MKDYLFELHSIAMDFMDDAESSHKKGDVIAATKYWEKAWTLERSYALAIPNEATFQLTRSIIFRSAGWLAIKCKKYNEAIEFMNKILSENPHPDMIDQLKEVLKEATELNKKQVNKKLELTGFLVSADIPFNQIKIQEEQNNTIHIILVSPRSIQEMVKSFWAEKVIVKGISDKNGIIRLENIRKAG